LPLSASAWIPNQLGGLDGTLRLRLSGARAAVDEAANAFCQSPQGRLGLARPLKNDEADAFWLSIRDQTHTVFHSSLPLWRVSLPARSEGHADFSPMLVEWGGGLRWIATNHSAQAVRAFAADRSGHAALYRSGQGQALPSDGVFMPLEPVIDRLHQRIREELDPMGLLNPGRLSPAMARAA
jgi:glycolate oxidase FAD binding subunit